MNLPDSHNMRKCRRCGAATLVEKENGATLTLGGGGACLSRTTRDEGAGIMVCNRCGARESLYGYDSANQMPFAAWPMTISRLLRRRRRCSDGAVAEIVSIDLDDIDA